MAEGAKTLPPPDSAAIFEAEQSYQRSFLVKAAVDPDYTYTELSGMCRSAGFEEVGLVQLTPMPQSLVVSRKA